MLNVDIYWINQEKIRTKTGKLSDSAFDTFDQLPVDCQKLVKMEFEPEIIGV